jgi:hypothetical protein
MTCRVAELAALIAHFAGEAPDMLRGCDEPVAYRTRVSREQADGGVVVTIRAELCDHHDRIARTDDGYSGSWVVRERQPT